MAGIAQSGSVTDAFIHSGTRIGFSRIVGSGAEIVLDVCDYLAHSLDDPETHTIILFVEGFKRPERFLALADRALELGKPILAVKVGRSAQAQEAAVAHSGSIAGEDRVTDAALAAAGVVRCADLDELLEAAELHAGCRRLGRSVGRGRTAGHGVDRRGVARRGPAPGDRARPAAGPGAARAAILRDLPTMGYIGNPIDPWGAADEANCYPVVMRVRRVGRLRRPRHRPRLPVPVVAGRGRRRADGRPGAGRRDPRSARDPAGVHLAHERRADARDPGAARGGRRRPAPARGAGRRSGRSPGGPGGSAVAGRTARTPAPPRGRRWPRTAPPRRDDPPADEPMARARRDAVGGRRPGAARRGRGPGARAIPAADAGGRASRGGRSAGPFVVKLDARASPTRATSAASGSGSPTLTRGRPRRRCSSSGAGRRAGRPRRRRRADGAPGLELIVGMTRDPLFGPAVLVGLGGVFTEVLDDAAIRLAPVARGGARDARRAPRRSAPAGARGDRRSTARRSPSSSWRWAGSAWDRPDIVAIDLNPVIATAAARLAVDALVVLEGRRCLTADRVRSVLLREPTPWGVRLVLNRPDKLNAISELATRSARRSTRPPPIRASGSS